MVIHANVKAKLPRDLDSYPVQILGVQDDGTAHITTADTSSARAALPTDTDIVRIASTGACYIAFGDNTVTAAAGAANSFFFPAGVEVFFVNDDTYTNVAARNVSGVTSGVVTLTRMK